VGGGEARRALEVEQFAEERFALAVFALVVVVFVVAAAVAVVAARFGAAFFVARRRGSGLLLARRFGRRSALDDLVEFAAIEPDAAAGGALVDFDAVTFAHHEVDIVDGAFHGASPFCFCGVGDIGGPFRTSRRQVFWSQAGAAIRAGTANA
jgi:hypothetical protein